MTPFIRIVYFEFEPDCGGKTSVSERDQERRRNGKGKSAPAAVCVPADGRADSPGLATLVRLRQDWQ